MTAILDPDLLRAFVAVAEHRSFTRAAPALHRTQSAASTQIKRLEDRLGAPLFHRTTSHVELTPAGERLMGYARQMLALNDEAVGRVRLHTVEGVVRLGVMDDYGSIVIPPRRSKEALPDQRCSSQEAVRNTSHRGSPVTASS